MPSPSYLLQRNGVGAKIRTLVGYIQTTMAPDEKLVVFSGFTKFLDVARTALATAGFQTCRSVVDMLPESRCRCDVSAPG
jgi:hypothetical protein